MYVATLISALAASLIPPDAPERNELLLHPHSQHPNETEMEEAARKELEEEENAEVLRRAAAQVERYRARDRLVPSRHNVVSIAVVEVSLLGWGREGWLADGFVVFVVVFDDYDEWVG